jgi:glycine/serine hydroxymethyltransferase
MGIPDLAKKKGSVDYKTVRGIATQRSQPLCVCGSATYRLNADFAEVCSKCNEPSFMCDCKPTLRVAGQVV